MRIRKAWRVKLRFSDNDKIKFAPTSGNARYQYLLDIWDAYDRDGVSFADINVCRAPKYDVRLPARDPICDKMSKAERHCLLHAFGGNDDPIKAGYRDYYYTDRNDPTLVSLTQRGLMSPNSKDSWGDGMTYFRLTDEGKRVALSMIPEYAP